MNATERMRWNLENMGYTGTTSKRAASQLIRWATEQGMKVHTDEVKGHLFVITDEED